MEGDLTATQHRQMAPSPETARTSPRAAPPGGPHALSSCLTPAAPCPGALWAKKARRPARGLSPGPPQPPRAGLASLDQGQRCPRAAPQGSPALPRSPPESQAAGAAHQWLAVGAAARLAPRARGSWLARGSDQASCSIACGFYFIRGAQARPGVLRAGEAVDASARCEPLGAI